MLFPGRGYKKLFELGKSCLVQAAYSRLPQMHRVDLLQKRSVSCAVVIQHIMTHPIQEIDLKPEHTITKNTCEYAF
jgi:hypothetical protein